ncbi:MAG: hypothetical protein U0X39_11635 [Bacteroidales bacterium]
MVIRNRFDKTFGPFGSSAGFFLMVGGAIITWFNPLGTILIVAGSFAAFTTSCTFLETEKRQYRYCDLLFGFVAVGQWKDIEPSMRLGLRKSHRGFVAYTRANQPVGLHENDIRLFLVNNKGKEIAP